MNNIINGIRVRSARPQDAEAIALATRDAYMDFDGKDGFILGYRTPDSVREDLPSYYVAELNGEYAGHAQLSFALPPEFCELRYYDESVRNALLETRKCAYIEHIVIKRARRRAGVGIELIRRLCERYDEFDFFSSVVVLPYRNDSSLRFHIACGFIAFAYYERDIIDGMRYESEYFMKAALRSKP